MTASCASRDRPPSAAGCRVGGTCEERGGIETRDASGAVVWGRRVTSGFHGMAGTVGVGASRARVSAAFLDVGLSLDVAADVAGREGTCRSGLRTRVTYVSRVVMVVRSVRRSSDMFVLPPVGVPPLAARFAAASAPSPDAPVAPPPPAPAARLLGRGFPDAVRLCDVLL